jgi:hypothetical protein
MFSSKFGLLLNRNISINTITSQCLKKSCYSTDAPAARKLLNSLFFLDNQSSCDYLC